VIVAESTRRLVGNLFELEDLGAKNLKGVEGPVRAWAALRPSSVESRFEALHGSGLTQLVGREEELELLLRRWSKAKSGEGQVVLLSGEAGIGKSRLTAALLERFAAEPHTRLRYFCSPQRTDSTLFPIIHQMERAAGFAQDDIVQAKLNKLDALMEQSHTPRQDIALFADMLSLPNDGRYPTLDLTPQQRRQKTLEALRGPVETFAGKKPVLMILEDAHWADPTSLEVFSGAVDRTAARRALLIITFRPEFEPPWIGQPHVTSLTLNRLTRREVEGLIDRVAGNKPLAGNLREDIIERTDGIPLFVEEMTKAVLEAESQGAAERAAAAIPAAAVAVPATLHASLMARLDRLGAPAKEVAQISAAIGREFSQALLAAVMQKSETDLNTALDPLVQSGLLFRQGVPPHASYLFKHALVQDAAYGTLLREPRRGMHARIAKTLETNFAGIAEAQPEILARHYTEAGLIEKASGLWGKAGQRSFGRSALVEAVEQLTRALDQIATLPDTAALRREEIKLQVALIPALFHVKGYAAPDTKAAVERARLLVEQAEALGEPPEDPLLLYLIVYGVWVANYIAFSGDVCRNVAEQFLTLAEKQRTTLPMMIGHRITGVTLVSTGDFMESRAHLDRAFSLYDPAEHRVPAARLGQDPWVTILSFRSWALWFLGYPEAALTDAEQALRDARKIGQAATSMVALSVTSWTHMWCGNYAAASSLTDELVLLAGEKGAAWWKAIGTLQQAQLFVLTGNASRAVQTVPPGITALRSTGGTTYNPMHLTSLAKAYADLGQFDDAWRCIEEALTAVRTTKERMLVAEINRVAGEITLMPPLHDTAKAQSYFERALAIARQQQAKSWELRASMSLARLWRSQGKVSEAREMLAPVYGWFTEGFDTRDLKEAKALLDELHA
jgi:predicted ATPase